jgi:hypothetical protein
MKNTTIASNKLQLDVLGCYQPKSNQGTESKSLLALRRVWQESVTELKTSNNPRIWQTIDQLGNTWWHAYNPATGRSATRESETEILEWIERM